MVDGFGKIGYFGSIEGVVHGTNDELGFVNRAEIFGLDQRYLLRNAFGTEHYISVLHTLNTRVKKIPKFNKALAVLSELSQNFVVFSVN